MPSIVTTNVSQQVAPAPDTLQRTGALVSQGATTSTADSLTLLTQAADLDALLVPAAAITSMTWLSDAVTVNTTAAHGITVGQQVMVTIAGVTPAGYNGTYLATATDADTFTYPMLINPGAVTVEGTWVPAAVAELDSMVATFFAQGNSISVYVLELGISGVATGVGLLTDWIEDNPLRVYSFLVPRAWSDEATFRTALVPLYEAPDKKTYFYTTMTTANYTTFDATMKCVKGLVEAPNLPATEFSHAADFWHDLHYDPSTTNKVTPNAFAFLFGVTPYPTVGNGPLLEAFKTAGVNYVGTGAEGGISTTVLLWGTTMDKNDFTYWYSADWVQINVTLSIANAIINGSNDPTNPLLYDQKGIDRLSAVVAGTVGRGVSYGLVLGTPVELGLTWPELQDVRERRVYPGRSLCNAVPFIPYSLDNPSDYIIGRYAGLSVVYTPSRGFTQIVFNLVISQFVVA